jgi:GNAT superfamily N-acetyltransferase
MAHPQARPELRFEPTPYDHPVAAELIETLQQTFVERYGGRDVTPVRPEEFAPPLGLFLVGRLDEVPMSCGGWRLVDGRPGLAEVKRMFVAPGYRGLGLSRVLLGELEATARAAGVRRFRMETGSRQPEAIRLYETSGYVRIEKFGVYKDHEGSTCFGKDL